MIKLFEPGLQYYVDKLNQDEFFSINRLGNGEWDCIMALRARTGSRSQYFTPSLRKAMTKVVMDTPKPPGYYLALQNTRFLKKVGLLPKIEAFLAENGLEIPWHLGDVFHRASEAAQLAPLVKALSKKRVVVVGPPWLESLPFATDFVPIVPNNCWDDVDEIMEQILPFRDCVISLSAGPAAKVLVDRLFPILGHSCWILDMGSLWDPFCGVKSRTYHRRMDDTVIPANLGH